MEILALQCNEEDNVAVIFAENVAADEEVTLLDKKGNRTSMIVKNSIPYGHKTAIRPIKKGEEVIKYGESIGVATSDIAVGEHVHVHNIDSQRGRGDLAKEV